VTLGISIDNGFDEAAALTCEHIEKTLIKLFALELNQVNCTRVSAGGTSQIIYDAVIFAASNSSFVPDQTQVDSAISLAFFELESEALIDALNTLPIAAMDSR